MAENENITKLENYEAEDINDVIVKLEKSFGLKFEKDAFQHVITFGDLCDVFEKNIQLTHVDNCTTQQAFNRVRYAFNATQHYGGEQIHPDTSLAQLFPLHNRRQKTKEFIRNLGTEIKILTYPDWLVLAFGVIFLLSIVAFFFDWKIALSGIAFFLLAEKIADKFGKNLNIKTVRELTEKLSRENYIDIRRNKGTVNKAEIIRIIRDSFSIELGIDKHNLTREDKFGW